MNDIERDDKLIAAASALATGISPERDLWPEIAGAISRPQRSRWMPMLAQAAAVVLLIGASSSLTYVAMKDSTQIIEVPQQGLVFQQASFGNNYALGVTTDLGLEASGGVVRVGIAHYNTLEDVRRLKEVREAAVATATRRPPTA